MAYYVVCETCNAIHSAWNDEAYAEKIAWSQMQFSSHEFFVTSYVSAELLEVFNSNGGNWNN